jgi:hypothetical protein
LKYRFEQVLVGLHPRLAGADALKAQVKSIRRGRYGLDEAEPGQEGGSEFHSFLRWRFVSGNLVAKRGRKVAPERLADGDCRK